MRIAVPVKAGYSPKSYSPKIRIDPVNQILKNKEKVSKTRNIKILTRIVYQIIYSHVYQIIKIQDLVRAILYVMLLIENIFRVSL